MQVSASNKSLDGLLGAPGEGNLPHWLQPETFMLDNFKSELVVADLRRYVSLIVHEENTAAQSSAPAT
eukprot:1160950-Pelagomonas_calceolata.AAC.4